ncbi:MAG: hypothetical protein JXR86_20545 [Spirochaetales bacterium]|nr:hypothetical protein [Spirochaetales bacterium]
MKEHIKISLILSVFTILFLALVSCENPADPTIMDSGDMPFQHNPAIEDFDEADRPYYESKTFDDNGTSRSYELMRPWNYDKDYNAERSYPLLINISYTGSLVAGQT